MSRDEEKDVIVELFVRNRLRTKRAIVGLVTAFVALLVAIAGGVISSTYLSGLSTGMGIAVIVWLVSEIVCMLRSR